MTRLPFQGPRRPVFLIEREQDGELPGVSAIAALENPSMNGWAMEPVYGWAPKSTGAVADRVTWTEDGRITVEWDMGDPARHTRVTQYTWFEEPRRLWSTVRRDSVTYRPEAEALRYPATPKEVLQAAFVARWLGLTDELPRYFASPKVADGLAADQVPTSFPSCPGQPLPPFR